MSYRYAATDPRLVRGRYFYAEFEGESFLTAYADSRRAARLRLAAVAAGGAPRPRVVRPRIAEPEAEAVDTLSLLAAADSVTRERVGAAPVAGADSRNVDVVDRAAHAADAWLSVLARKFEVGRVLRARYGADLKPIDRSEVAPDAYAFIGSLLARRAAATAGAPALGALSSLLKVGDLLDWLAADDIAAFSPGAAAAAAEALRIEGALVDAVVAGTVPGACRLSRSDDRALVPPNRSDDRAPVPPAPRTVATIPLPAGPMTLLAADTARARAYLDVLAREGQLPDRAIVVELREAGPSGTAARARSTPLFDNVTPLAVALSNAGVRTVRIVVDRFEDPPVLRALDEAGGDLVIVAGPPGVILAPAFFDSGRSFLHVHPGRLPDYRGSTPMYYEYLVEGSFTATALLLDAGIDTGSIIAARRFEPPADMTTIDGAFDPWMRAELLRDVIRARASGTAVAARPQGAAPGHTYHVIHPVLRHVALLRQPRATTLAGPTDAASSRP